MLNVSLIRNSYRRAVRAGLHPGAKYKKVKLIRLVGIMLIVFVREELVRSLHNVIGEYVGTGILGRMVSKQLDCAFVLLISQSFNNSNKSDLI